MDQGMALGCLLWVPGHICSIDTFWSWLLRALSLVHFVRGGFSINQRRAAVLFSLPLLSLLSRIIFQIKYWKESTGGLSGLLWCFYKRIWCSMFSSMIFFGYSLWVFILPFQLFENFCFGTLKLNSIHISQRFTVDSFGNYASCGQIDFSWGGSWETLEIKHPHKGAEGKYHHFNCQGGMWKFGW